MNNNMQPTIKTTTKIPFFRRTVLQNFPFIEKDFDALTDYELLCKVVEYLNEVIEQTNLMEDNENELVRVYNELYHYVENYFDNLDVQEEINNKLDEMAEDGSLTNLIKAYVDPIYQEYENSINNTVSIQNSRIASVENELTSVASGSPLVASNVSGMTDTTRVYVNTSDGKWYYYDGDSWEIGGTYQSTGLSDGDVFTQNLETNMKNRIKENVNYQEISSHSNNIGKYTKNDGTLATAASYTSCILDVKENDKIHIDCTINNTSAEYTLIYKLNSTVVSTIDKMNTLASNTYSKDITVPSGVNKIAINYDNRYSFNTYYLNITNVLKLKNENDNVLNVVAPLKEITPDEIVNAYITVNKSTQSFTITPNSNYNYKKYDISNLDSVLLKYKNNSNTTVYTIIITDNSDNVLFIDNYTANLENNAIIEKTIYKPTNGKYLYIQNNTSYLLDIYKRNYLETIEVNKYDKFAIKNLERRCTNLEKQNPFEWSTFDKTYFAFVIDDCNSFFPKAVEIFSTNNTPLSSATLVNKLNNVYTTYTPSNTKTVKELLQDMVNDGGEVLAHYTGNLAPAGTPDSGNTHYLTTDADWLKRTRDVKMTLEDNGFDVRGIITADSTITRTSTGQKYCSLYFDYSDTLGTSPNFYLGRRKFFLANDMQTVADVKSYIDTCCQTPGFYPFCFHGTRQDEPCINETDLNEILTYIASKGSSVCECTTYSYVIDHFGSTELNERLKEVEN